MKEFNTNAVCIPSKHYMVDLSERVIRIRKLIDSGKYFTINRARQYGKTTTLDALQRALEKDYFVASLSFEGITKSGFETEQSFVKSFCRLFQGDPFLYHSIPEKIRSQFEDYIGRKKEKARMDELFITLGEWCAISERPIVLFIDEVDKAANNDLFLDFLGLLRDRYIKRERIGVPAFKSVVLAGVTDIKHLKSRIRSEDDAKDNSPWNIAADFTIDMSLSAAGIRGMLLEYEADHHSGMDAEVLAKSIREYTNGYPFLVSRLCELIDTKVIETMSQAEAWSQTGLNEAIKLILAENNTLFQSLTKKLNEFPRLKESIKCILMEGTKIAYNGQLDDIVQLEMYGLIENDHNTVHVSNRIFEMVLYNLFLSEEELEHNVFSRTGDLEKNRFIIDNKLNMRLVLEGFSRTYGEVFGSSGDKFREKDGRELFLLYLKPIINGIGNYYIEAQTRDQMRTDVIVDYAGQRYIVELKIWRGEKYNATGEEQLMKYLDRFNLTTGYMLSFNFNKNKQTGTKRVHVGDKSIYEVII